MSDDVWDEELFTKGLEKCKGTLGAEYVEKFWRPLMISPAPFRKQ